MRIAIALAALLAAAGCGGPSEAAEPPGGAGGAGSEQPPEPEPPPPEDLRVLGAGATFAELVSAARRLDERREADSTAGCILRGAAGAPWRLEADLSVAVRPLPDAPADLDERLAQDGGIRVLTRWGQLGAEARDLALVAFTTTPPLRASGAAALFLTDEGVYLRRVGEAEVEPFGPVSVGDAGARVQRALSGGAVPLFVTAEAGQSIDRLRDLLHRLPEASAGVTALAVPLAPETRLPDAAARSEDTTGTCPDGLPEPAEGTAEGELAARDIVGALGPLREGARGCFDNATGPAALGGRTSLALRIGPEGAVTEACFREDEIGDPGLRACVLEAARATHFPSPDPPGIVDAIVPLVFEPDASLRQPPLCP